VDIEYFRVDFQVNHRFSAHAQRRIRLFSKTPLGKWSRKGTGTRRHT
jgi:hypothetical protein